jgi:ppGpp synthetase/RelA/SpoT-type nucleotidyltranferase
MDIPSDPGNTGEELLRRLEELRPEVSLPGYWRMVAKNCGQWAHEISVGPYWTEAKTRLDQWRTEYRSDADADLLPAPGLPDFVSKAEKSIRDKVFRDCKDRPALLEEIFPVEGPAVPRLNDLVRTRVACRYIDGVEFLASKLASLGQEMGLAAERHRRGSIEGYFAQHITLRQPVIYRLAGAEELTDVKCEIQVASEMATHMWDASHPLYESIRSVNADPEDWQWKPDSPRFISHQLGHMIHLADGLLVQLRRSIDRGKV